MTLEGSVEHFGAHDKKGFGVGKMFSCRKDHGPQDNVKADGRNRVHDERCPSNDNGICCIENDSNGNVSRACHKHVSKPTTIEAIRMKC